MTWLHLSSQYTARVTHVLESKKRMGWVQDSQKRKVQVTKDNFFPVPLGRNRKEIASSWFQDLAGSKPLVQLAKKVWKRDTTEWKFFCDKNDFFCKFLSHNYSEILFISRCLCSTRKKRYLTIFVKRMFPSSELPGISRYSHVSLYLVWMFSPRFLFLMLLPHASCWDKVHCLFMLIRIWRLMNMSCRCVSILGMN